jgi:Fur family ferric uptake transcriptional regulator
MIEAISREGPRVSCESSTVDLLRQAGHKLTPQRLLIVSALRHAEGHVTAAEIADEVKEQYPYVDISTVYRTLDVLKRERLATVTDMGTGDATFEWVASKPHHHLICIDCGDVESLEHGHLEDLGRRIEKETGFTPDLHHFAIFGLCAHCRGAREGA